MKKAFGFVEKVIALISGPLPLERTSELITLIRNMSSGVTITTFDVG